MDVEPDVDYLQGIPSDPAGQMDVEAGDRDALLQRMIAGFSDGDLDQGQAASYQATIDMTRTYVNQDIDRIYGDKVEADDIQAVKDALNATLDRADAARNSYIASNPSAPPAHVLAEVKDLDSADDEDDDAPSNTFTVPSQTAAGVPDEPKVPPTPAAAAEPVEPDTTPAQHVNSPETEKPDSSSRPSSPAEPSAEPSKAEEKNEKTTAQSTTTTERPPQAEERKSEASPAASRATEEDELERELEQDFEITGAKKDVPMRNEPARPAPQLPPPTEATSEDKWHETMRHVVDAVAAARNSTAPVPNITVYGSNVSNVSKQEGAQVTTSLHSALKSPAHQAPRAASFIEASPETPTPPGYNAYATATAENARLEQEVERLREEVADKSLDTELLMGNLDDARRERDDAAAKAKAAEDRVKQQRELLTAEQERNRVLKSQYDEAKAASDAAELLRQENEALKAAAQANLADTHAKLDSYYRKHYETLLAQAQTEAKAHLTAETQKATAEFTNLRNEVRRLQSELDNTTATGVTVREQLEQALENAQTQLRTTLDNQVANETTKVAAAVQRERNAQILAANTRVNEVRQQAQMATLEVNRLRNEVQQASTQSQLDQDTINRLSNNYTAAVTAKSLADSNLVDAERQNKELQDRLNDVTAPLQKQIETLRTEGSALLASQTATARGALAKAAEAEKEARDAKDRVAQLEKDLAEANAAKEQAEQAQQEAANKEAAEREKAAKTKNTLARRAREQKDVNAAIERERAEHEKTKQQLREYTEAALGKAQAAQEKLEAARKETAEKMKRMREQNAKSAAAVEGVKKYKRKLDELDAAEATVVGASPEEVDKGEVTNNFINSISLNPFKLAAGGLGALGRTVASGLQLAQSMAFTPVAPTQSTSTAPSSLASTLGEVMSSEQPAPKRQNRGQDQISPFHQKVIEQARNMPEPVRQGVSATGGTGSLTNDDEGGSSGGRYSEFRSPVEGGEAPLPTEEEVAETQQLQENLRTLASDITDTNVRLPTVREKGRDVPVPESETEMKARLLRDQLQERVREPVVEEMKEANRKRKEKPTDTSMVDEEARTEEEEPYVPPPRVAPGQESQIADKFKDEVKTVASYLARNERPSEEEEGFRRYVGSHPMTFDNAGIRQEEAVELKRLGLTAYDITNAIIRRGDMRAALTRLDRKQQDRHSAKRANGIAKLERAVQSIERKVPNLDHLEERWRNAVAKLNANRQAVSEAKKPRSK
jgi:hypothetical protein